MTRNVKITVINHTQHDLSLAGNDMKKGRLNNSTPATTLFGTANPSYKPSGQLAVSAELHNGGPEGWVLYNLPEGQGQLSFMFASPKHPSGSGNTHNSYCYAPIINIPPGSTTSYYVTLSSNTPMKTDPPVNEKEFDFTVNLYSL